MNTEADRTLLYTPFHSGQKIAEVIQYEKHQLAT